MPAIIELKKITFGYRYSGEARGNGAKNGFLNLFSAGKSENSFNEPDSYILKDFSLKVEKGAKLIVRGRSGAGKTTLLRLLAWMEEPVSGEMFFEGKPYHSYLPPQLRKKVSLVPQKPVMLDGTVRQNLLLGCGEERRIDENLVEWLDIFGLGSSILDKSAHALSVGQQQRVAVIRTLLINPKVLLLDEPTSGLDPESTQMFLSAIRSLAAKDDLTLVWNSHNFSAVKSLATDVITINGETE